MPRIDPELQILLPPLSTEEREALKADIAANGVRDPIVVDESGNILDGMHRFKLDKKKTAKFVTIEGLTDAEKKAFTMRANYARRNLSPEQKAERRDIQKRIAEDLREEDVKKWTQKRIAAELGVARNTVSVWFTTNVKGDNSSNGKPKLDARVKLTSDQRKEAVERVQSGESQAQVAADFGVSQQAISKEKEKAERQAEKDRELKAATRKAKAEIRKTSAGDENGVFLGDSFKLAESLPDECCSLIFTDPPYDKKSIHLYDDLAALSDRVLVDGGSLITYLGQYAMPDVITSLSGPLKFFWPLCCLHTGKTAQMTLKGIKVKWKPMLWFVKGTNRRDTLTWVDDLVRSKQEKDDHPWQQSVIEASYYIEKLSKPGELVIDPFCGGGTTAFAAKETGRMWWTADKDARHVQTARDRIRGTE